MPYRDPAGRTPAARSGSTTSACVTARRRARSTSPRVTRQRSRRPSRRVWRGEMENDGFNRLVLRAGLAWREVVDPARLLQVPAPGRHRLQPGLHGGDAGRATRRSPRLLVELFRAPLRSRRARRRAQARRAAIAAEHRARARRRSRTSTRTASCAASSTCVDSHAAHQLLPDAPRTARRSRISRSSSTSAQIDELPLPRPLVEIFVYAPRVEGDPSARRQGRARRHPLVRPARGFPHRDPRPDEGADGEERRHRAGRLEGRLRRQAAAGRRRPRGARRPKASPATRR